MRAQAHSNNVENKVSRGTSTAQVDNLALHVSELGKFLQDIRSQVEAPFLDDDESDDGAAGRRGKDAGGDEVCTCEKKNLR